MQGLRPRCGRLGLARLAVLAVLGGVAPGCALWAPEPAVRVELPVRLAVEGRRVAVVGDLQLTPGFVRRMRGREDNAEEQHLLMQDLRSRLDELGALVIVGDMVFTARSNADWRHFDRMIGPIAAAVPVLPAVGNHDYHCFLVELCTQRVVPRHVRDRFPWLAPGTPYWVPADGLGLIFLDSETGIEAQASWLEQWLADNGRAFDAALVFFHRPPYSSSMDRGAYGDARIRELVVPVLDAAELPVVVVNGHIHGYEHQLVDGVHYVTSAGGGGPRGLLGPDRPNDVYAGRDCRTDPDGAVLRPFNYLLIGLIGGALQIDVRGFCRQDDAVSDLETFRLPLNE